MVPVSPENVLSQLNDMRKDGKYCDVVICVGKQKFPCHRVILAASISYFDAMFGHHFKETNESEIPLNNIDELGFKNVLDYVYTGKIEITSKIVKSVLSIASFMRIECLLEKCINHVVENIDIENAMDYHLFANDISIDVLKNHTSEYIEEHFETISESKQFLEIPFAILQEFLNSDYASTNNEENIFKIIEKWVYHDFETRLQYVNDLLKNVRFNLISTSYIIEVVLKNKLVLESMDNIEVITANSSGDFNSRRSRKCMHIFGKKFLDSSWEISAVQYNGQSIKEPIYLNQKKDVKFMQASVLQDQIYLFTFNSSSSKEFNFFNNNSKIWSSVKAPEINVPAYNMIPLDVIRTFYMNTSPKKIREYLPFRDYNIYCYIADLDLWHPVSSMSTSYNVHSATLVGCGNVFYSCGGTNSNDYNQAYLCMFDPRLGRWSNLSPMPDPNSYTAGTILNNRMYITGGWNGSRALSSAIVYDIRTDKWKTLKPMSKRRDSHSLLSYGDKLYAIGGKNSVVEIYDPTSDMWTDGSDINNFHENEMVSCVF